MTFRRYFGHHTTGKVQRYTTLLFDLTSSMIDAIQRNTI